MVAASLTEQQERQGHVFGFGSQERPFGADDERDDRRVLESREAAQSRTRLADIVATEIIPRLALLHSAFPRPGVAVVIAPSQEEIAEFAILALNPNVLPAERHVLRLRDSGVPIQNLFVGLLEPAARHLGRMWDNDECDFLDVTRGLGCLQMLLAKFELDYEIPAVNEERAILMSTLPGEEHSFGMNMVEKFLMSWGWRVRAERATPTERIVAIVRDQWFAVVGLHVSSTDRLTALARAIHLIRTHSRNSTIGILVGGSVFLEKPELVATVGADATATNASLALLAAQKLLNIGIKRRNAAK